MLLEKIADAGSKGVAALALTGVEHAVGGVDGIDAEILAAALGRARHEIEAIAGIVELCLVAFFAQFHAHHHSAVGVGTGLVADIVTQRVGHQRVSVVAKLYGLRNVWMSADDMVNTLFQQPVGQLFLFGRRQQLVFYTPVGDGDDEVGFHLARLGNVGLYFNGVDIVHNVWRRHLQSVGSVGEVEQYDAESVLLEQEGILLAACLGIDVGAQMRHGQLVHQFDGALQTLLIGIQTVVVGRQQDVETGINRCLQELVGGAELRVGLIGFAAQGDLKIGNGHVGTLYFGFYKPEALLVAV